MKISTVADAIAAMDYLHKRQLLCDKCGIHIATIGNANHSRCEGCRPAHGEMYAVRPANELERRLCEAVREWLGPDEAVAGAPAVNDGGAGASPNQG